ncbi:MAG: hypothetical protein H8F28_18605 [Fibrella sp.]|nr:hypothetical protein [Armatimonadota bacterium]
MSHTFKSFIVVATVVAIGATSPLTAFSAPKPDAPNVTATVAKPKPVMVVKPKKATRKTTVIIRRADRAEPIGLKVVVIDEPNLQEGTISVVTEKDEFATIATGMGTRIARGYQLAGLNNIHAGYTLRCQGAWDQDGFQYQASRISLGETKRDTDVIARVNAACENIGKARKGGGFGKSLVAMIPRSPTSQGVSVGGQPYSAPSSAVTAPIPADLVAPQGGNNAPETPPATPASPVDPALLPAPTPAQPTPAAPQTIPPMPQGQPK